MNILQLENQESIELPLQLHISFEKVFLMYKKYAAEAFKDHPFHEYAKKMVAGVEKHPELIDGFSDFTLLEKLDDTVQLLLDPLFPEPLLLNEIKSATIPFTFTSFKFTTRFKSILDNAGDRYVAKPRNFEDDLLFIYGCTLILASVYDYHIDLKRPFFFDIPNVNTGITRHYRAAFNGDFGEISPTKDAPKITDKDIKLLLDNFDNIAVWKEKFPPNSYIYKGFGIMNLFDVTTDETISNIRTNLLRSDDNLLTDLQNNIRDFFNIKDLKLGYAVFDISTNNDETVNVKSKISESIIVSGDLPEYSNSFFCDFILETIFKKQETFAISDIEKYGRLTNSNPLYNTLVAQGIGSIILIPIKASSGKDLSILEIASPRPFELNSINQNKLKDIIPVFKAAIDRFSEEHLNVIEATIQEHYTTIHSSVKWRFVEAAENYQQQVTEKVAKPKLNEIVFNDVYPLFGQSDIKGSSIARNEAIQEDLATQLALATTILDEACTSEKLPIYDELIFRVKDYATTISEGLKAGDEIAIIDFLKREIYPVFNHIKQINEHLFKHVTIYMNRIDDKLQVVYEKRKDYEDSVTLLNDKLAKFLDQKQEEAQAMFPHYFERYKTDGIEYNMYIGSSLVKNTTFDMLFLYNLRLWQLQMMCELENVAFKARSEMHHELRVASLILVHSNPLAIKFRMDEKQFDVDGAYNIRYEIIKKRIDKAHIKDSTERVTVPGKIAIVYAQDNDAIEYLKYIKFLQSKNYLGKVEKLDIEDLQGVSGLKALRAEVLYHKDFNTEKSISLHDLIEEIKA